MAYKRSVSLKSTIAPLIIALYSTLRAVEAFSGSEYVLDTDYSGINFFDGWDFYTGEDPTHGFVTYYDRSAAQLTGLINSSATAPAYFGVDYINELPITSTNQSNGAGRPSVRLQSRRSWTHGLFIGDFDHAPSNICGTWPAFWTLGPMWPSTGEIDIMEGVNMVISNEVSLHTNDTCTINSDSTTQLGHLSGSNCAYYPGDNTGCGVVDNRPSSYSDFNSVGGGVYAMQWTSEYIRVWFFPRQRVPTDIINQQPDPSSWGLPAANFMGNCDIDEHFQQHYIVFDTTFCGDYAGNKYVWNSEVNSCAVGTGYSTCEAYVAKNPSVFQDAYWSVNYVRVYQLVDPSAPVTEPQYIASLQPAATTSQLPVSTLAPSPTASLCPTYNFTLIQDGGLTYEIACNFNPPGPDIPPPYEGFQIHSFEDCVAGCTYWNTQNGTNTCGGVAYDEVGSFCYFKKYVDQAPSPEIGFGGARLIYYGYPLITDDPRSQVASATASFVEIIPTPQYYVPAETTSTSINTFTSFSSTNVTLPTAVPPPLGSATNTTPPSIGAGTPTISYSGTGLIPVTITTAYATTISDQLSSSASTTSNSMANYSTWPDPTAADNFEYFGCKALLAPVTTLIENSQNMTVGRCITNCANSYYAALHGSECYCVDVILTNSEFVAYPGSACRNPCPGNTTQDCGGDISQTQKADMSHSANISVGKRQAQAGYPITLFTLYFNRALLITVTTISTFTSTITLLDVTSTLPVKTNGPIETLTTTKATVATTWLDYCETCPGYMTTRTTTITIPCQLGQIVNNGILTVPMTTMTRSCNCGLKGAASTITITVPHEAHIAAFTAPTSQIAAVQTMSIVNGSGQRPSQNLSQTISKGSYYPSVVAPINLPTARIEVLPVADSEQVNVTTSIAPSTVANVTIAMPLMPLVFTGAAEGWYACLSPWIEAVGLALGIVVAFL